MTGLPGKLPFQTTCPMSKTTGAANQHIPKKMRKSISLAVKLESLNRSEHTNNDIFDIIHSLIFYLKTMFLKLNSIPVLRYKPTQFS
jgi:hypothetical protein